MKRDRIIELHFYEWRIGAWATSETRDRLDAAGRGIYRELLDQCYGQGKFPDDPEWICRKCACTREEYEKTWPLIVRHFPKIGRTRHRMHVRAGIVRSEYGEYVDRQRARRTKRAENPIQINEIGDAGSECLQPNGNGNGNGNGKDTTVIPNISVNQVLAADAADQPPAAEELTLNSEVPEKRPKKIFYDQQHETWYAAYWCHNGKAASRKAYEKAVNRIHDRDHLGYNQTRLLLAEEAVADRKRFEGTVDWEWRSKLHPATWLNGERWKDELALEVKGLAHRVGGNRSDEMNQKWDEMTRDKH